MVGETVAMAPGTDPGQFLRDLWYMPALAKSLAPGQMRREMLLGHRRPFINEHYGLFGCMMIAGTAALLYARDLARGYIAGALGGLVIGAACGLVAVGVANLLGDHPDRFLPYGVMICALVGAIGGLFGQYAAWIRAFIATLRQ